GVHFTRTVHGELEAGPNAVLAFAREGYTMTRISPREFGGTLAYVGFWKMALRYWRTGIGEFHRSLSKGAFIHSLQRLVPEVRHEDAERAGAGVRAQAIDRSGALVDDFRLVETANALHVLNAPSPAATASLAIGQYIAARVSV
ncbi:MAG: L-2-hydroxyglutarate oxidase, partial [Chloroflexi bacterium]|nr:L-2-hydroxyglutarate oxidase [Chloroflexota bacterium]